MQSGLRLGQLATLCHLPSVSGLRTLQLTLTPLLQSIRWFNDHQKNVSLFCSSGRSFHLPSLPQPPPIPIAKQPPPLILSSLQQTVQRYTLAQFRYHRTTSVVTAGEFVLMRSANHRDIWLGKAKEPITATHLRVRWYVSQRGSKDERIWEKSDDSDAPAPAPQTPSHTA